MDFARMTAVAAMALAMLATAYPAVAKPKTAKPPAAQVAETPASRLRAALEPYRHRDPGEPGWHIADPPQVSEAPGGGLQLRVAGVSYVLSPTLAIDLGQLEGKLHGDELSLTMTGEAALRGPDGYWAQLTAGGAHLTGTWDGARGALSRADVLGRELFLRLANGAEFRTERLEAKGVGDGERFDGSFSVHRFIARSPDGRWTAYAEEARMLANLKDLDGPTGLVFDYSHTLAGRIAGLNGELIPSRLSFSLTGQSVPWAAVVAELPPWLAEVAQKLSPSAGQVWGALWTRMARTFGAAGTQASLSKVQARSVGLNGSGRADLAFAPEGASGTAHADVKGINDRIASLTRADRQVDSMHFPGLALMTVLGDAVTENGQRFHRFKVDLDRNVLKVNGRDAGGIKP